MEKLKKIIIPVLAILVLGIILAGVVFYIRKEKDKGNYYVTEYDVSKLNPCISRQYSDNKAIYLSNDSDTNELLLKTVYFSDNEIETEKIQEPKFFIEENEKELVEAGAPFSKESFQGYLCVENDNVFILYLHTVLGDSVDFDISDVKREYLLYTYNSDGEVLSKNAFELSLDYYVESIFCDNSYFYVIAENQESERFVLLYDFQGKFIDEIYTLSENDDVFRNNAGGIIVFSDNKIQTIIGKKIKKTGIHADYVLESSDDKYSFVYYRDKTLFGYTNEEKSVKIRKTDLPNYNYELYADGNLYGLYASSFNDLTLGKLSFSNENNSELNDTRETLILGTVFNNIPSGLIRDFNAVNPNYRIEVRQFDTLKDFMTYIGEGNQIDLYDLTEMDEENLIRLGMLKDVYELMEKDPEINKDDFTESLKCMETDGSLYSISSGYYIETVLQNYTDSIDWNYENMFSYAENNPKNYTREDIMFLIYFNNSETFDDLINGQSSDLKENLLKDLEKTKLFPSGGEKYEEHYDALIKKALEKGGFFTAEINMEDLAFIDIYNQTHSNQLQISGYPTTSGNQTYLFPGMKIGISSSSKNMDAVWEFARRIYSYDYEMTECYITKQIPLRKDCLHDYNLILSNKDHTDNKIFGELEPFESNLIFGLVNLEETYGPASYEGLVELEKNNEKLVYLKYDETVFSIISEEMQPYWGSGKPIDSVYDSIINRLTIYYNEKQIL